MSEPADALVEELEAVAARLRSGALDADEAAALVERCAELAGRLGAEIDSESRAAGEASTHPPDAGQERRL